MIFQCKETVHDRNIFLHTAAAAAARGKKNMGVSYFSHFYQLQKKLLVVEIEEYQFPFQPPTLIYSQLWGAINTQHFILTLITQINLYSLAAVALSQNKISRFGHYSSTKSGSLTGEAIGRFVGRMGEPEVMHS